MIVNTPGSQMGSAAAAEGGGDARGGERGESEREVESRIHLSTRRKFREPKIWRPFGKK